MRIVAPFGAESTAGSHTLAQAMPDTGACATIDSSDPVNANRAGPRSGSEIVRSRPPPDAVQTSAASRPRLLRSDSVMSRRTSLRGMVRSSRLAKLLRTNPIAPSRAASRRCRRMAVTATYATVATAMANRIAPSRSVPVSSWGISAHPAEGLGGAQLCRSQGRKEGHHEHGGVDECDRQQDVRVIEDELTLGREAGQ